MTSWWVEMMDFANDEERRRLDRRDELRRLAGVPETPPTFAVAKSSKWYEYQQRKVRQSKQ